MNKYKIVEKEYKNNAIKRKIAEALLIKQTKPTLNKQDNSVELKVQLTVNNKHLSIHLIVL